MSTKRRPSRNREQQSEFKVAHVRPLTGNQAIVLGSNKNQVLSGYAGTGKTFLASKLAYDSIFETKEFNKFMYPDNFY